MQAFLLAAGLWLMLWTALVLTWSSIRTADKAINGEDPYRDEP